MARIRSIHPEQWTDEDFLACSPLARLLALGIRNDADDQGVFIWKPQALKWRLLPADDSDVVELLEELVQAGQVVRFEEEGKAYGLVRNFRRFQSPKSPSKKHPLPGHLWKTAGLAPKEADASPSPTPGLVKEGDSPTGALEDGKGLGVGVGVVETRASEDGGADPEVVKALARLGQAAHEHGVASNSLPQLERCLLGYIRELLAKGRTFEEAERQLLGGMDRVRASVQGRPDSGRLMFFKLKGDGEGELGRMVQETRHAS